MKILITNEEKREESKNGEMVANYVVQAVGTFSPPPVKPNKDEKNQ